MASIIWVLYVLTSICALDLPLPCIASPTDLTPRDPTPFSLLPLDGSQGVCKAIPWRFEKTVLYAENLQHEDYVVIMIQTNAGGILCYISPSDMGNLWISDKHSRYRVANKPFKSIFQDGYLGKKGHLMKQLNKLQSMVQKATDGCQSLDIYGAQIGAPQVNQAKQRSRKFEFSKGTLIERMALRLQDELRVISPDNHLDVTVFPIVTSQNWKYTMWQRRSWFTDQLITGEILLGFSGINDNTEFHGQIAHVPMTGGSKHPRPDKPSEELIIYDDGKITYDVHGVVMEPRDLTWRELSQGKGAENQQTLRYSEETKCAGVLWSSKGSLISFMNVQKSTIFITQTSVGAIMCYIPAEKWEKKKSIDESSFIGPLRDALNEHSQQSGRRFRIFQSQFWFIHRETGANSPAITLVNSLKTKLKDLVGSLGREGKIRTVDSNVDVDQFTIRRNYVDQLLKNYPGFPWTAVWQPAITEGLTDATATIWLPGGAATGSGRGNAAKDMTRYLALSGAEPLENGHGLEFLEGSLNENT